MIGQQKLSNQIDKLIQNGFPRFVVITGKKGQGKKYVSNYISRKLKYPLVDCGTKKDELKQIISLAYEQTEPIIYLIADADNISNSAKNSLLKVIEEPPNNAYFIMTLESIQNTLETVKSRCIELKLEHYTQDDINNFITDIDINISNDARNLILQLCTNKYEIEQILKYNINEFYNYMVKVCEHISTVSSANAFKIEEQLALKDEEDKYDVQLFLEFVRNYYLSKLKQYNDDDILYYATNIQTTSQTINSLKSKGANKQHILDMWILAIRKNWRDYKCRIR